MRLDWNEIRARAAVFSREWKDAHYERGETQSFYNELFEVFGVRRRRVASFEHGVNMGAKRGFLDLFWKGKLLVEQKSAGRDLKPARTQVLNYFPGLRDYELPRYILLSDFQNFELYDLDIDPDQPVKFKLKDLPAHVESLGFIVGHERRVFRDQDPVNISASELMGKLHDALLDSPYDDPHALERFLVRILFCVFADDTGIFQPLGIFEDFIKERTSEGGTDVGAKLIELFQVLNTPENRRPRTLDADLAKFPYVNGALFADRLPLPAFNSNMRKQLIEVCEFNWTPISPAIFGSLFQSVMDSATRRRRGAHYTSEKNILKVIEPLFLENLKAEFERLKASRGTQRKARLQEFHEKLGALTFLDPACGCGNFLAIAYREVRDLELSVLDELYEGSQLKLPLVNVNQFYGIEIGEFAARIAEVSMWMMDHIMNVKLSATFGQPFVRIPLRETANIKLGDALEFDWEQLLPPDKCAYVLGNPPFIGAKQQSDAQRAQTMTIAQLGGSGGSLDYVCSWFIKAGEYVKKAVEKQARKNHTDKSKGFVPGIGFVTTNSITQGQQVAQLWPVLFKRHELEIAFAHRTFQWYSDTSGGAHVHCVIVGLVRKEFEAEEKRLFSYETVSSDPVETRCKVLSPYLIDAAGLVDRHIVVDECSRPILDNKRVVIGSKPIDGGYFIFTKAERDEFIRNEPGAKKFMRPYIGGEEFINGDIRYILALQSAEPNELRALPSVVKCMKQVSAFRRGELLSKKDVARGATKLKKRGAGTVAMADRPTNFHVTVLPTKPFLVIPENSSERREYVPIAWLQPPTVPSNLVRVIVDADEVDFGLLTSRMHMAWLRVIGGRLKSDYRYSIGVVYNPFPWPDLNASSRTQIASLASDVLKARAAHPSSTLADLYDPDTMPRDLRKAHKALDAAVDGLYRKKAFATDLERVEHLLKLYEEIKPSTANETDGDIVEEEDEDDEV